MKTRSISSIFHGVGAALLMLALPLGAALASDVTALQATDAERSERTATTLGIATVSYAPHTDIALKMRGAIQPYRNMKVDITDTMITLSGSVESPKEKEAVLRLAEKMGNGKMIRDELRVDRSE